MLLMILPAILLAILVLVVVRRRRSAAVERVAIEARNRSSTYPSMRATLERKIRDGEDFRI